LQKNLPDAREAIDVTALRGVRVLIVDDNMTNRMILQELTSGWEMKPTLCDNGEEALVILENAHQNGKPFPLVILDAQMPGIDGFSVAETLRLRPHLGNATVIMLTSAGLRGDSARCRELGIQVYLPKPVRRADLLASLKIVLGLLTSGGAEHCTGHRSYASRAPDATAYSSGGRQRRESSSCDAVAGKTRA
jgi:CheY-like chemotaxis protein